MAAITFNASAVDTSARKPIDPGVYEAVITSSEVRPTKSGGGTGLNLMFEIVSGPMKGKKVWSWINYLHPTPDVQERGQRDLALICNALGIAQLTDTVQLHNIPVMITVALDRRDQTKNIITDYAAKAQVAAAPVAAAQGGTGW